MEKGRQEGIGRGVQGYLLGISIDSASELIG